jgi:hypothetical protein
MNDFDHDPVKDLFDRERKLIIPQRGDDLHWQSIVRRSRIQRRSRFLGYAAGMTAAALVIGGVAYGASRQDDTALAPASGSSTGHSRDTKTPAPTPTPSPSRPHATPPVRTQPSAPTAATVVVVLRPVTRSGRPAPGYTVTDEPASTIMCGPTATVNLPVEPSAVAVDGNILSCSPSAAYAVACWKNPAPSMALCFRDPWSKELARIPVDGSFPAAAAPSQAQPLGLLLSNGDKCRVRDGGAWSIFAQHPDLRGFYFCTRGKALWGARGSSGVNRSSSTWTVAEAPGSGSGPLTTVRVLKAYFIGTQGR